MTTREVLDLIVKLPRITELSVVDRAGKLDAGEIERAVAKRNVTADVRRTGALQGMGQQ